MKRRIWFKPQAVEDSTRQTLADIRKAWSEGGPNMMGYTAVVNGPFRPNSVLSRLESDNWVVRLIKKGDVKYILESKTGLRTTNVIAPTFDAEGRRTEIIEVWSNWSSIGINAPEKKTPIQSMSTETLHI